MTREGKVPDYGEPISIHAMEVGNPKGSSVDWGARICKRAEACVNALAGCQDPEAFINSVMLHIQLDECHVAQMHPNFEWLRNKKEA